MRSVTATGRWTITYYPGPPTIYHPAPSPFGIPYRSLYSVNIDNLFFAGRQISTTHMAMSSTRVMATTAMMGQAVGTAAAIALRTGETPRGVWEHHIEKLRQTLLDQDQFIPNAKRRIPELTLRAETNCEILRDGWDRDWDDGEHGVSFAPGEAAVYRFADEETVHGGRLVFDSDLSDLKRQRNVETSGECHEMPALLPRSFRLEYRDGGEWKEFASVAENRHRYVKLSGAPCRCREFRFVAGEAWGGGASRVFSFDVF